MTERRGVLLAAAGLLLAVIVAALAARRPSAGPSALSASSQGWSTLRRYAEIRGSKVELLDRPVSRGREGGVLIAFPEKGFRTDEELEALRSWVGRGNRLVLAFSGEPRVREESRVFHAFGMSGKSVRGELPVNPVAWYRFQSEVWRLDAQPAAGGSAREVAEIHVHAPRRIPVPGKDARILYRAQGGDPMVFTSPYLRGTVLVLPADALSNGRISAEGNADLAEWVREWMGPTLLFEEHFHGLSSPDLETGSASFPFDLLAGQLLLLYALAVLALSRRFGPAWRETPVRTGSTATFLLGLATRHRRFGHYREAGELLLERARSYDPALAVPEESLALAEQGSEESLLALGKEIGRIQAGKRGAAR